MNQRISTLAKSVLPASVVTLIRRHRKGDVAEAWRAKREFFWNAFKVLDFNGIDGDYVEFGSHGGLTFCLAFDQIRQRRIQRHMWAFDSFQGLPAASSELDSHPVWQKGSMSTDVASFHRICRSHGIPRDKYTATPGFYDDTLAQMSADTPPKDIALAYVDCDMYSSTKTVLEFLAPRLKHGMIIAFDDYFCWSADQISGERKALMEWLAASKEWNLVRYRDYSWAGAAFVVERADLVTAETLPDMGGRTAR